MSNVKFVRWGAHCSVDCKAGNQTKVTDAENIKAFSKELVKRIDMKAYGEPQVIHFGSENKAGYTLVQLIETSNICAHLCDDSGDGYFDVFSCKPFDNEVVKKTIVEFFGPFESMRVSSFERGVFEGLE